MTRHLDMIDPAAIVRAIRQELRPLALALPELPLPFARQLRLAFNRHGLDPETGLQFVDALRRLSRTGSLFGLTRVLPAFEVLLQRPTAHCLGLDWHGVHPYRALFAILGRTLHDVDLVVPQFGLGKMPELGDDRIRYFLYRACLHPTPPAAPHLLELCRRALWRAETDPSNESVADRSQLDRLPHELAVVVRKFPSDRLPENGGFLTTIRHCDVERAFDAYKASPRGLQTLPVKAEYIRNVTRALGIRKVASWKPGSISSANWPALRTLSDEEGRDVAAELETDEEGALRGLLAMPVTELDDVEHPLERARWIDADWGRQCLRPLARAEWFRTITDGRTLTQNELTRTIRALDEWIVASPSSIRLYVARFAFLVGTIAWTGLLPKRLLRARLYTGNLDLLYQQLGHVEAGSDADYVFILPELRILLCRTDPSFVHWSEAGELRPLPPVIPVPLPSFLWEWAVLAWGVMPLSSQSLGSWAFLHRSGRRPVDLSELTPFLRELTARAGLLEPLSWSRLRQVFSTYVSEMAQASPLLAALASGSPSRQEQVELHYISMIVRNFVQRCRTTQDRILEFATQPFASGWHGRSLEPRASLLPARLLDARVGARFYVSDSDLRVAWEGTERAIAEASTTTAKMDLLTLGFGSFLIAGSGIRERELERIMTFNIDLDAGILRLEGKPNGYFREPREIPLNAYLCMAIRRYFAARQTLLNHRNLSGPLLWVSIDGGRPYESGDLDRLIEREGLVGVWRSSPRCLRHWLRSALDTAEVPLEVIREPFGHVTETNSTWHVLSHHVLGELQTRFRAATAHALELVIDRRRLGTGIF